MIDIEDLRRKAEVAENEIARLRKENDYLRVLAQQPTAAGWRCIHGLDIPAMALCPKGFPGCDCADDMMTTAIYTDANADRIKRLEEALKPFATDAELYDPPENDDQQQLWDYGSSRLRLAHLRAARTALEPKP